MPKQEIAHINYNWAGALVDANAHSLDGSMALRIENLDSGVCYGRGLDMLAISRRGGCGIAPRRGGTVSSAIRLRRMRRPAHQSAPTSAAGEYALGKLVLVVALERCAVLMVWLSVTAGAWHFSGRGRPGALRLILESASLFQTFFSG